MLSVGSASVRLRSGSTSHPRGFSGGSQSEGSFRQDASGTVGAGMRLAIVPDVHGNLTALDAVIADTERGGVEQVIH
jgi:hypothetical protein